MNRDQYLRKIEHTLREAESMMRHLHPNFNSDAMNGNNKPEKFIIYCLKANEELRMMQRGILCD